MGLIILAFVLLLIDLNEELMTVITKILEFSTSGNGEIIDITSDVASVIGEAAVQNGIVTIFSPSATSALTTIEYESGCVKDLQRLFNEIADPKRHYAHNARWGDGNGHSHVRAALLGPSLTVPFVEGSLTLGTWQQLVFVDFDNRSRRRRLIAQVMGE
jgi:secondary thiamine-phosphate synthase enzyme